MRDHIVLFLNSQDEPEMADEVMSMQNRLDAFANGLDRAAFDAVVSANEELRTENERLKAELATVSRIAETEAQRASVLLKELAALRSAYEELRKLIDGGSESMTHEDAVRELKRMVENDSASSEPVAWRWFEKGLWWDWRTDWEYHDRAKELGYPIEYAAPQPAQSKDAERYRWLRKQENSQEFGIATYDPIIGDWMFPYTEEGLDAAIDAAMEKK